MTKEVKNILRDVVKDNHITDYNTIQRLMTILNLEELLATAEKELNIYGKLF